MEFWLGSLSIIDMSCSKDKHWSLNALEKSVTGLDCVWCVGFPLSQLEAVKSAQSPRDRLHICCRVIPTGADDFPEFLAFHFKWSYMFGGPAPIIPVGLLFLMSHYLNRIGEFSLLQAAPPPLQHAIQIIYFNIKVLETGSTLWVQQYYRILHRRLGVGNRRGGEGMMWQVATIVKNHLMARHWRWV